MIDKTVLLVEDNPDEAELTVRLFRKREIAHLVVARDGQEALDYVFRSGAHAGRDPGALPNVVLLDLKMPGVDGLEVLRRLREDALTKLIPVIILTSSKEDEDLIRGYDLGTNMYIRKPVDPALFAEVVQQTVDYWLVSA